MPNSELGTFRTCRARRFGSRGFSVLAAVGLLLGTAVARADDWVSLGLDAARSRVSAERTGAEFKLGEWQYVLPAVADAINRVIVSSPAVADGYVVFGTTTGEVVAVGAVDGRVRWRFQARDGIHASPAIVRGKVLVPSFDGTLYALRLADGKTLWTRNLGSVTFSSPAPTGDSVVVATGFPARKLVRIDATSGADLWATPDVAMDQGSNSSVAVAGDQVIVGAMAGTYYSFDLATGAPRWTYTAAGAVHLTTPVVVGGKAFFVPGGAGHAIHAVDLQTGQAAPGWPVEIPSLPADAAAGAVKDRDYAASSLAVAGGLLLFQQRTLELGDSDADGIVDTYLMREETIAVDPATAAIAWRTANGRVLTQDRNAIPAFGVCPTPLAYADKTGRRLAVTTSTLSSRVRVLDAATGVEAWSKVLSAATRSSPVMANGRLFVATDAGVLHGLLSSNNQPPLVALSGRAQPATVPTVGAVVSWPWAVDPEGDSIAYSLRLDRDGEILASWEHELTLTAGETSARLPWTLESGATYTYAVRARDDSGAWSEWSPPQTFVAVATPDVAVGGVPFASLAAALAAARSGDVVRLGAGALRLTETLRLSPGVTLSGAGPQRTVLDGSGLDTSVSLRGSSGGTASGLDHLTVSGGRVGVSVGDAREATLRNVVVHDAGEVGVDVEVTAATHLINTTIVRAGVAVRAAGVADIRNSLIVDNRSGLVALASGHVASDFNDVHGNQTNYDNVKAGAADMDQAVAFADTTSADFHLAAAQPTTDRGDPDDAWANEPAPNGGRINLGAFGNTDEAETSRTAAGSPSSADPSVTTRKPLQTGATTPAPPAPRPVPFGGTVTPDEGCAVAATSERPSWRTLALWALAAIAARRRRRRTPPATAGGSTTPSRRKPS